MATYAIPEFVSIDTWIYGGVAPDTHGSWRASRVCRRKGATGDGESMGALVALAIWRQKRSAPNESEDGDRQRPVALQAAAL